MLIFPMLSYCKLIVYLVLNNYFYPKKIKTIYYEKVSRHFNNVYVDDQRFFRSGDRTDI